MKLPKKRAYPREMVINGEPWELRFKRVVEKTTSGKPLDTAGLCDPSERVITIQSGLSIEETFDIWVHELLHAFEDEYGIKLSSKRHRSGDRVYKLTSAIVEFIKNL